MATARAATETEAANAALRNLGVAPIASLASGTSTAARECRAAFGDARDETLRQGNWNFAAAWITPAAAEEPALGPLKKAYPLPADCIRVRGVDGLDIDEWAVETLPIGDPPADANVLVCNIDAPLVSYTRRITNVALWDAEFLAAFAMRLASKVAPPLNKEFTDLTRLDEMAGSKTDAASKSDAQERAPTAVSRDTSWITIRRTGPMV